MHKGIAHFFHLGHHRVPAVFTGGGQLFHLGLGLLRLLVQLGQVFAVGGAGGFLGLDGRARVALTARWRLQYAMGSHCGSGLSSVVRS